MLWKELSLILGLSCGKGVFNPTPFSYPQTANKQKAMQTTRLFVTYDFVLKVKN